MLVMELAGGVGPAKGRKSIRTNTFFLQVQAYFKKVVAGSLLVGEGVPSHRYDAGGRCGQRHGHRYLSMAARSVLYLTSCHTYPIRR